jgi:hypothetical protein
MVALGAACGPGGQALPLPTDGMFVATQANFQSYASWPSFTYTAPNPIGGVHTAGVRTEYINAMPAHGAAAFPVGTIIVKHIAATDVDPEQIFAMVKRGGGFNADGAEGWEWFELKENGTVLILWRGVQAPPGEQYSSTEASSCNGCHVGARTNDFVQSPVIRLEASAT